MGVSSVDLVEMIRSVVRHELACHPRSRLAVVTEVDIPNLGPAACAIQLQGEEAVLKPVPVLTPHLGLSSPPAVGDLVVVDFLEGDPEQPVVLGRAYSEVVQPTDLQEGDLCLENPPMSGCFVKIAQDQTIVIQNRGTRIEISPDGALTIQADAELKLTVEGPVELKCQSCKVDAESVELGNNGSGVITQSSHKCYFTGAPLVCSTTVKAAG